MTEEEKKEAQGQIQQVQIPVYEDAIYVARTLTILCGFASESVAWDSESGYFYQLTSDGSGKGAWKQIPRFKPRKLALPMLELLKKYTTSPNGKLFLCTPREVENVFHQLFNLPLL